MNPTLTANAEAKVELTIPTYYQRQKDDLLKKKAEIEQVMAKRKQQFEHENFNDKVDLSGIEKKLKALDKEIAAK